MTLVLGVRLVSDWLAILVLGVNLASDWLMTLVLEVNLASDWLMMTLALGLNLAPVLLILEMSLISEWLRAPVFKVDLDSDWLKTLTCRTVSWAIQVMTSYSSNNNKKIINMIVIIIRIGLRATLSVLVVEVIGLVVESCGTQFV